MRKGGLGGQGLNALIKSTDNEIRTSAEEAEKRGVLEIDISLIDVNPDQPRKVFNEEEIQGLAESIKENGTMTDWKAYLKALSSSSSIKKPSEPENPCSVLWMIPSLPKPGLRHGLCIRLKMRISTNPTLKGNRTMGIRPLPSCFPAMALSSTMPSSCMTSPNQR